jgi:hypothetical protein
MSLIRFVCLIIASGFLLVGSSEADDDVVPDSATLVDFDFAHHCKVGDHTFRFEKTTLADIIHELGSEVICFNGGDASYGEYFVEYAESGRLIRFSSNAEMGGDTHDLEEVEIVPLSADEKEASLPPLRLPVIFQFGSVGMSFLDLENVLGKATKTGGIAWFKYSGKKPIKVSSGEALDYNVFASLRVRIVFEKVAAIQIGRVSSN